MAEQKFKAVGLLGGVACTQNKEGAAKAWKRASLSITNKEGIIIKVATFEEDDIKTANEANGKDVEAVYTKSKDEQYNNLIKGGLSIIGQGEAPVKEEEAIEEGQKAIPEERITEKEGRAMDPKVPKTNGTNWELKNQRDFRAMSIAYAKDLCVADKIKKNEMKATAHTMYEFIWEGYEEDKEPAKK